MEIAHDRKQFAPIEGLRAYLALWVAIGHALQNAGYLTLNGRLGYLLQGDEAVNVFIIVSGFVITNLVITNPETYPQYITRRFFRLFPALAVCCAIGAAVLPLWAAQSLAVPWQTPEWTDFAAGVVGNSRESIGNPWPHVALHALMLHGAIPEEILAGASGAFLPVAWSISLEWQFYLLAPFVILATRHGRSMFVAAAVFFLGLYFFRKGALGTFGHPTIIFGASGYFAIGIGSRLSFESLKSIIVTRSSAFVVLLGTFLVLYAIIPDRTALFIWAIFYFYLMAPRGNAFFRMLSLSVTNKIVLAVGTFSYSLYLVHRPIEILAGSIALHFFPAISRAGMLLAQFPGLLAAVGCAYLLWRFIEVPGQRLGKIVSGRFKRTGPAFA